jgi:hypothetical protein
MSIARRPTEVRLKEEMAEEFARQMTIKQAVHEGAACGIDNPQRPPQA